MGDAHRIRNLAELREVIPEPNAMIEQKIFDHVDAFARRFIERAPLIFVSTVGADGGLDVSPKGDAAGFVEVQDDKTLLIPERPGNKLAYGFRNILENPRVGLIFVIPGVKETLRINGSAEIWRDPPVLERLSARNKPAILVTRVTVEESFFHCGKALIRSSLWKPDTWPRDFETQIGRQIAARSNADPKLADAIEEGLQQDYETGL